MMRRSKATTCVEESRPIRRVTFAQRTVVRLSTVIQLAESSPLIFGTLNETTE